MIKFLPLKSANNFLVTTIMFCINSNIEETVPALNIKTKCIQKTIRLELTGNLEVEDANLGHLDILILVLMVSNYFFVNL